MSYFLILSRLIIAMFFYYTLKIIIFKWKSRGATEIEKESELFSTIVLELKIFISVCYLFTLIFFFYLIPERGRVLNLNFNFRQIINVFLEINGALNSLAFMPLGIFLAKKNVKIHYCLFVSSLLILTLYGVRYYFSLGNFLIIDLLLNLSGIVIGIFIAQLKRKSPLTESPPFKWISFLTISLVFTIASGFIVSRISMDTYTPIHLSDTGHGISLEINSNTNEVIGFVMYEEVFEWNEIEFPLTLETIFQLLEEEGIRQFGEDALAHEQFSIFLDTLIEDNQDAVIEEE